MKKTIILFILTALTTILYADDYNVDNGSVIFSRVIENTGKTVQQAHDILEAYFATAYNDVNSTEKLNKEDHLIYKGLFIRVATHTFSMWRIDVPHTVDVAIKNNRIRIMITVTDGINKSETGASAEQTTYNIATSHPVVPNASPYTCPKKAAEEAFNSVRLRCESLIDDIEEQILLEVAPSDDW